MSQEARKSVQYRAEIIAAALEAVDRAEGTRHEIAKQHGVSYAVLQYWVSRRRKEQRANNPGFVRVEQKHTEPPQVKLRVADYVLELGCPDVRYLVQLLRALAC
jgi:transposase-like protein